MRNSNRRAAVLERAAPIFNRNGYAGTSIAAILEATNLEKGGLYNYFASKEELALETFDYSWARVREYFAKALHGTESGMPRLHAYVDAFVRYIERPVVDGGCPLANAALEADDALPFLRDRVASAIGDIRAFLLHEIDRAIAKEQVAKTIDRDAIAHFIIATLEGTMMLARSIRTRRDTRSVAVTLHAWLNGLENA